MSPTIRCHAAERGSTSEWWSTPSSSRKITLSPASAAFPAKSRLMAAGTRSSASPWMTKKGGIRKNWLDRYFELDADGTLRYFADCNEKPVKKGGSTKTQLCGYDEKGVIELKDAQQIRMSTAPNPEPGEIEILTSERTYRMAPGRSKPGARPMSNKSKAGHVWCLCMNLAKVAASDATTDEMLAQAQEAADALASA